MGVKWITIFEQQYQMNKILYEASISIFYVQMMSAISKVKLEIRFEFRVKW